MKRCGWKKEKHRPLLSGQGALVWRQPGFPRAQSSGEVRSVNRISKFSARAHQGLPE